MIILGQEKAISTIPRTGDEFKVAASAKLFAILSTKLYQNPIAAVVRELATNAHDSHIAAGNTSPFKVSLPSRLHPFYTVEDFGVGLDDNDMRDIYGVAFESTKDQSNEQTGAFGVGRFSAFSISETFNIVARKNGIERHYVASFVKADNAPPRIDLIAEMPTEKANGVKVSVPVREHDFNEFNREASWYLSFFKNRPTVNEGFKFDLTEEEKDTLSDKGWLFARNASKSGNYVVMGGVPYSVGRSDLADDAIASSVFSRYGGALFAEVPLGSVGVATSRETLSIGDKEQEVFKGIRSKIEQSVVNEIRDVVEGHHPLRAIVKLEEIYGNIPTIGVPERIRTNFNRLPRCLSRCVSGYYSHWLSLVKNPVIIFNDTKKKYNSNYLKKEGNGTVVLNTPLTNSIKKRLTQWFGTDIKWIPYSEVFNRRKPVRNYKSSCVNGSDKKNGLIRATTVEGQCVVNVNEKDVYWVERSHTPNIFRVNGYDCDWSDIYSVINYLDENTDECFDNVVVITKTKQTEKNIIDFNIKPFAGLLKKVEDHVVSKDLWLGGFLSPKAMVFVKSGILDDIKHGDRFSGGSVVLRMSSCLRDLQDKHNIQVETLNDMGRTLWESGKYPMLQEITSTYYGSIDVDKCSDYVRMVEQIKKLGE